MSETTTQAIHELLLGMNRDMKNVTRALETISQQLHDQIRAAGGPALGLCGSHVAEWIRAGSDPGAGVPAAQTVFIVPGVGAVPVCLDHFGQFMKSLSGSQLLAAQPAVPEQARLVVPGR